MLFLKLRASRLRSILRQADDYELLARRKLTLPIRGLKARDIRDTFAQGAGRGKTA